MILVCKVTPNARRSECAGWSADERGRRMLLLRLAAPPLDGKANQELVRFMAEMLGCAKGTVVLERGGAGRVKTLTIPDAAADRLPRD